MSGAAVAGAAASVADRDRAADARRLDLRLLVPALLAWAIGAWALGWPVRTRLVVAAVAALLGLLLVLGTVHRARHAGDGWRSRASRGRPLLALTLLALALVLGASSGHDAARRAGPVPELADERASITAEAVVLTEPVRVRSGFGGEPRVRLRVRLEQVTARGETTPVRAPVLLMAPGEWARVGWHDRVRLSGRLAAAERGDEVVAHLSPRGPPEAVGDRSPVRAVAEHMRTELRGAVEPLPADAQGLLPALVIGDTSQTPPELSDDMLLVGMSHLSAVSGSNVAVVLAAVIGLTRLVALPRRWRPWAAGAALAFFVVLARPEPSVLRAATMGAIGLLGLSASRRGSGPAALCAAILLLLSLDPWLARSYGFALSTLATLGLLLLAGPWSRAINAHLPKRLHLLGPAVAIPLAAQLVCAPVVVLLQGTVSIVAVLANLLAAPLVAPATIAGVLAAVVAVVHTAPATLIASCGAPFALGIAAIARVAADAPGGGAIGWPDGPPGALLLAAVTTLGVLAGPWLLARARASPVVAGCCVVVLGVGVLPERTFTWPPPDWRFVACDVGQGDALVLASGPGRAVLVDAGPEPDLVDGCLDRLDVTRLDAIVLTHLHADHVDGLAGALDGRRADRLLLGPVDDPPEQAREVHRLAAEAGVPSTRVVAGDTVELGQVRAEVWWPARRISEGSASNNGSVVLRADIGGLDTLLLGDVEREAGRAMLLASRRQAWMQRGAPEVLKMPHHGSANLDEDFLDSVAAPTAIISVGADNTYGHPSPSALTWLAEHGTRTLRTDTDGDVAVRADGSVLTAR